MKATGRDIKKRIHTDSKEGRKHADRGWYDKAFECYRRAFTEAEHLGIDGVLRCCAFNIGVLCVLKRGDYEAGMEYLQKAIIPDSEEQDNAEVFNLMANGYEKQGNLDKAYENYCKVRKIFRKLGSSAKEIEALENMVRISNKRNNSQQALNHINELIRECDVLEDREGEDNSLAQLRKLKWMVEKGHVFLNKKEKKKALEIAKDCLEEQAKVQKVSDADVTTVYGIFNELGLLLTHLKQLQDAVKCFRRVTELIPNLSPPQLGINKQNLGAVHNFMEKFEEAISYHKEAADLHASPHTRASQGHCYCNKAYAHFQLGDLLHANISFHLALEAAKEAGDLKTQWQALEGLGTVALEEHNFSEAVDFFRQAFTFASRTSEKETQDRLMRQLQNALSMDSAGPPSVAGPPSTGGRSTPFRTKGSTGTMQTFIRYPTRDSARMEALASGRVVMSRAGSDPTRAIASNEKFITRERKNGKTVQTVAQKRVLKVRRSGSLRKFEKVALGIQASQTMGSVDEDGEDSDSEETTDDDDDDDTGTDSDDSAGIPHAGDTVPPDEEEDKAALRKNMKQCLSEEGEDESEEDEEAEDEETEEEEEEEETLPKRPVSAQIHQPPRLPKKEETKRAKRAESSSTSSSDSSSSDQGTPRERKKSERPSASGTYEKPVPIGSGTSTGNYAEIDFDKTSELRKADAFEATGDSTVYETIKPGTSKGSPDNEATSADNPGNLSRAQREKMMFEYHQQREETLTAERNGDAEEDDKKKSKTCSLM